MVQLNTGLTLFFSLLIEALPFLLVGVFFSSYLRVMDANHQWMNRLPKNGFLGAVVGSCLGLLLPVGESGRMPVTRRLLLGGAPTAVSVAFLLAAPAVNPVAIFTTWLAFAHQPDIIWLRVGSSLLVASFIGWIFSWQLDMGPFLNQKVAAVRQGLIERVPARQTLQATSSVTAGPLTTPVDAPLTLEPDTLDSDIAPAARVSSLVPLQTETPVAERLSVLPAPETYGMSERSQLIDNMVRELRDFGLLLVLGCAIAASIQVFVPPGWVLGWGQSAVAAIAAASLLGVLASTGAVMDSFFAQALTASFTRGTILVFLVLGSMVDFKSIPLLLGLFKGQAIVYLFALATTMTLAIALAIDLFL